MSEYLYPKTPVVVVECLLIALLVFTPLAFGTVKTWATSVMEFVCVLMVMVWLVGVAVGGARVRFRLPLGVPLVLFAALVFGQMLPHFLGEAGKLRSDSPFLNSATTNLFSTKTAFVKLLCYIGLYVCLINTLTSRGQITAVLTAVVLIGFGVSFLGLLQRISGTDKVFWLVKMPPHKIGFMATFVNENHFAGYMEMVIPITIAFALRYLSRMRETEWRGILASSDLHKALSLSFLAIIMIVSLAVSRSRGGLIGFVSSVLVMGILLLCRRFHRRKAWAITVLLTLSFMMLAWIGLRDLLKTWGTLGHFPADESFKRRMEVAEAAWRGAKDYPVWGTGLGTFETVFPKYGTLKYEKGSGSRALLRTTPHAENDYVQTLLETGWAGCAICLLGVVIFFRIAVRTYLTRRRRSISMPAMGGAASIFAILVHSFSDFNMRIDANVFLLVTIVAGVVSLSKVRHPARQDEPPDTDVPTRSNSAAGAFAGTRRWAAVAIPLAACLVLMEAVVRQFTADRAFNRAKEHLLRFEELYAKQKAEAALPTAAIQRLVKKAVKLEPHCAEYRNYLGRYYQAAATDKSLSDEQRMKLARQAMRQYEEAVRLDPLNGVHHAYLAWMQGVLGQHEKAVDNFEKAIRLNRTNEWVWEMYDAYRESLGSAEGTSGQPRGIGS